jgi:hypothetical protein
MARSRRRPELKKTDDFRACDAMVQDEHDSSCRRRCRAAAKKGGRLCPTHQTVRDRVDNVNLRTYCVTKNFKPPRINKDGSYRRTIVGKPFPSYEHAWTWANLVTPLIYGCHRKGERVCSYTVEACR